ncbi:hypothetical protein SIL78_08880 [Halomonas alkaliphila]|uniref:Uncharacterized protein n=1 Tax=Vreelandella alkaliphila TaxID=272774 RepID=A0AAJ2VTJ9_9GAMM|nr:hypothetical protein [Halomonas alkaliphila]MDX5977680.1 hypothetical protein [Halomonas alkaliphila]
MGAHQQLQSAEPSGQQCPDGQCQHHHQAAHGQVAADVGGVSQTESIGKKLRVEGQ